MTFKRRSEFELSLEQIEQINAVVRYSSATDILRIAIRLIEIASERRELERRRPADAPGSRAVRDVLRTQLRSDVVE